MIVSGSTNSEHYELLRVDESVLSSLPGGNGSLPCQLIKGDASKLSQLLLSRRCVVGYCRLIIQLGNNNGLGGYYDVGCLRYGFYPTRIPGVFANPPRPDLYWEQGTYCPKPKDLSNEGLG